MKRKIFLNFIIMTILLCLPISANSNVSKEEEVLDFNVDAIEHVGQLNKNVGYFHVSTTEDLIDKPLVIKLYNNSDQDEEYQLDFKTARTNQNGLIVYDDDAYGPNSTLKYNLEEFVETPSNKTTVPAKGSKKIEIKIDTSKFGDVNGILVGALKIYKTKDYKQETGIGNRFAYQLGVVLNSNPNGILPNSEMLSLDKDSVNLILNNNRKVIEFKINNLEAQIARNLTINSKLVDIKNERTILKNSIESASIAPNGVFPGLLDWERYDVQAGDYKLMVSAADGNKQWSWEHDLSISKEQAKEINELSSYRVMLPKYSIWILPLLMVVSGLNHYKLSIRKED